MNGKQETKHNNHPFYSKETFLKDGQLYLPVASNCNLQCNFCNRRSGCPGCFQPSFVAFTPTHAVAHLVEVMKQCVETTIVHITGPGDPFAHAEETLETLRLARMLFPKLNLCLASNGLNISRYVDELAMLQVGQVTLHINAIDPAIGSKIYRWVRHEKKLFHGKAAAVLLGTKQIDALIRLKQAGIRVKVNTVVLPGINDDHILEVAKKVSAFGAAAMDIVPFKPIEGSAFEQMQEPDVLTVVRLRLQCEQYLPLVNHYPEAQTAEYPEMHNPATMASFHADSVINA